MKSTVEHLNPTRVKLSVEVPFDELGPHFSKAYGALAGQVRVPGFRPGKVPARILDARLGRGAVLSEVVNDAVPVKYGQALSEANLTVLGQPDIEITKIEDGQTLEFTAEVDVRPDVQLPDLDTVSVSVADIEVTDADVDEQIQALQERFATTVEVDRPAAAGDQVTLDLLARVDGEEVADATTTGLHYTVGSGDLVDGLDEAVTGLSAGESKNFATELVAGDQVGASADVRVTVGVVSQRSLPELDDDFAQLASEFDTVDGLRADLTERVTRIKRLQQGGEARDAVLSALVQAADIPAPEGAVTAEYDARQHDAVHSFDHDEARLDEYLATQNQTREEFDTELRQAAEEAVRAQLVLDALADGLQVGVDQQEFTERIIYQAQRFGVAPDEYFQRLQDNNQVGLILADVRRGKALATAVERATVTDASQNVLDVAELFGVEAVPDDEDDEMLEQFEGGPDDGNDEDGDGEEALDAVDADQPIGDPSVIDADSAVVDEQTPVVDQAPVGDRSA